MFEPLRAMGFETLQGFEQITNSPENVSAPVPPFGHVEELTGCRAVGGFSIGVGVSLGVNFGRGLVVCWIYIDFLYLA